MHILNVAVGAQFDGRRYNLSRTSGPIPRWVECALQHRNSKRSTVTIWLTAFDLSAVENCEEDKLLVSAHHAYVQFLDATSTHFVNKKIISKNSNPVFTAS